MGNVFKTQEGFSASIDPVGKRSTASQKWQAVDYTSQALAFAAIDGAVESTVTVLGKLLVLDGIDADEDLGDKHYSATAKYIDPESPAAQNENAANNDSPEISFDITSVSQKVTQGLSVQAALPAAVDKYIFFGAINVEKDSKGRVKVNGTDTEFEEMEITVTGKIPQPVDPFAFARALSDAVGCRNSAAWYGWGPHDLRLRGARVGGKRRETWTMSYRIACGKTVNITVPGLGNIEKRGQDYFWVYYQGSEEATAEGTMILPKPKYAFCHVMGPEIAFTVLGIGG